MLTYSYSDFKHFLNLSHLLISFDVTSFHENPFSWFCWVEEGQEKKIAMMWKNLLPSSRKQLFISNFRDTWWNSSWHEPWWEYSIKNTSDIFSVFFWSFFVINTRFLHLSFKIGTFSIEDEDRFWRSLPVSPSVNIDAVHDKFISEIELVWKKIFRPLNISYERVHHIGHVDLDMWKNSAKWVLERLNLDQKRESVKASRLICAWFD